MRELSQIWRAARVRRWHTSEALSGTDDRIDGHSSRVVRIILALNPTASRNLIIAALTHDDGEYAIGDISKPTKDILRQTSPDLWAQLDDIETNARADIWGEDPILTDEERRWITFADRLDALIWAGKHGVDLDENGWPQDRDDVLRMAKGLGVWFETFTGMI